MGNRSYADDKSCYIRKQNANWPTLKLISIYWVYFFIKFKLGIGETLFRYIE